YWNRFCPQETRTLWSAKLNAFAERNKLFPGDPAQQNYIAALQWLGGVFAEQTQLYPKGITAEAGEYLFHELITGDSFSSSQEAHRLVAAFTRHLASKGSEKMFEQRRQALAEHPGSELDLVRDWVRGFMLHVAQVSKPAVSQISKSASAPTGQRHAGLETGDT